MKFLTVKNICLTVPPNVTPQEPAEGAETGMATEAREPWAAESRRRWATEALQLWEVEVGWRWIRSHSGGVTRSQFVCVFVPSRSAGET
jgi:hypothetical protein